MKLLEISVKNFRSIAGDNVKLSLDNSDIIFIFGQNNAGKSSLLTAYEYLITPKQKALLSDFLGFTTAIPIEISAIFLKDHGDDNIFNKKGFDKWVDGENKIRFRKTWVNLEDEGQKETYDPATGEYVTNGFGGLEQHFTKEAPTPVRIPALPTYADLTKFIKDTVQKKVLKSLKDEEAEAYQKVINEIETLHKKLLSKESLAQTSLQANNQFQKIFPDLTLEISQVEGSSFDFTASLEKEFSVVIRDSKYPNAKQDVQNHGHGVIRQTLFNFLGVVKNELPSPDEASNRKDYLILFEEPEIYLHPKAINLLRKVLYDLCSNSCFQIICASHSPTLIDISKPHTSLVRMVRTKENKTFLYQVGDNLFGSTDEQKNMVQMINRFDPNICSSFFADEVVLVEGDTETIVVRELLANKYPQKDIFVTNTGSKNNIPFFQKIFSHFNIKQHIIHDSDTRFVYEIKKTDDVLNYQPILNKDQSKRKNSAWTLNEEIWKEIEFANQKSPGLSQRYVSIYNFEVANKYSHDSEKGKPLSAYEYVKGIDLIEKPSILEFVNEICGAQERKTFYTQDEIEKLVKEPE
ncbi:ATP-dependent nuclease [Flavobacterium capsici]|uniref:AAA family ATPase n=1 Tax=Flavobacterium capsici TaxID=3075618 RepID=A0AA96EZN0_9FLAO|nr:MULTISPECIES: AAA family ATPase [unclassified Flavobacterium]WNM18641.1 AAA family ATPase [Flavobacterium sp. PMR2A8]WNM22692.1 AAA family ATPase [Flavobacterium sp. PMTSA4]